MRKHCRQLYSKLILISLFTAINGFAVAKTTLTFNVTGISGDALENAKNQLDISREAIGTLNYKKIQDLYENGPQSVKRAIEPYGYFRSTIKSSLRHSQKAWVASYRITPGKQMRISELNFTITGPGKNNRALNKTLRKAPLKQGDILNVPNYQKAKTMLMATAQSQGYIKARFAKDKTTINVLSYHTVMNLTLDTGPRYYFGPISFSDTPFSTKFLKRFVNFKEGQPFNPNLLSQLQSNYNGTGYFRSISVEPVIPKEVSKSRTVPVKTHFNMHKQQLYRIGLGYGTETGPRISGGITWRWINRWGQKFDLSGFMSRNVQQLNAQYLIPGVHVLTDYYTINAAIFQLNPPHGMRAIVYKLGPGYLWKTGKWTWNVALNRIWEKWRLGKDKPYQTGRLLQPEFSVSRLSVANPVRVENGSRLTFSVKGSYKPILSTVSYIQPQASFKYIRTLGKNNRFIFFVNGGYTVVNDQDKLPLSEQYFAGGPGSILGYAVQAFGPGRYITVANLEYQRRVYEDFYGAVFYNIGNAFNSFKHYTKDLNKSAGVAAVWRSPIGDVTVYVARALSKKGQPFRFGFNIGPEL